MRSISLFLIISFLTFSTHQRSILSSSRMHLYCCRIGASCELCETLSQAQEYIQGCWLPWDSLTSSRTDTGSLNTLNTLEWSFLCLISSDVNGINTVFQATLVTWASWGRWAWSSSPATPSSPAPGVSPGTTSPPTRGSAVITKTYLINKILFYINNKNKYEWRKHS